MFLLIGEKHASGIDTIYGGSGDDFIVGGMNADILYGGTGNDIFAYESDDDFGDSIKDFAHGDKLFIKSDIFAASFQTNQIYTVISNSSRVVRIQTCTSTKLAKRQILS